MGFRQGARATVWSVDPRSDTMTRARISISKKNKQTGQYEQDFGGFVSFVGSAVAKKAASLKEKDKIKLGDVDVSNRYDKEKGITYTNFNVFSFDLDDGTAPAQNSNNNNRSVDDGEVEDDGLPF